MSKEEFETLLNLLQKAENALEGLDDPYPLMDTHRAWQHICSHQKLMLKKPH